MMTRRCQPPISQGERSRTDLPSQPGDGTGPANTLILDFEPPDSEAVDFSCLSSWSVVLCYGNLRKVIQLPL